MDKTLMLKLNGNRKVCGTLRGFDQFMNVVLDETREIVSSTEENGIGMVVSSRWDGRKQKNGWEKERKAPYLPRTVLLQQQNPC
jgi:small nuclear ribonucleoprotein G